jgi:excisionase family DNA binding protein
MRDTRLEKGVVSERIFYRVSEVADLIGCSKSKAYELVASGAIASTRIGTLLRVPRSALEVFSNTASEKPAEGEVRNAR